MFKMIETIESIINTGVRAVFAYFLLLTITRLMGRKTISQMTFFDFAVAITLGSLTANLAMGSNNTSLSAATVMVTLAVLAILTGFVVTKSFYFRKLIDSEPIVLIENGLINEPNMKRARININLLNSLLREKKIFNIGDVEFALLENNGKLSVLPKSQKKPVTPSDINVPTSYQGLSMDLIMDGQIKIENLKAANLDEQWLMDQLKNKGIGNLKDVFFAALDTSGNLYVSKKIKKDERPGEYGIE